MRSRPWLVITTALAVLVQLALLAPSAWAGAKYKVLHSFGARGDGTIPYGPPVLDGKGNLYGVTITGGTGQCSDYGCGTVFELAPQARGVWREVILHNFTAGSGGSGPDGNLIIDSGRNLYGTINGDGSFATGGVFELSPNSGGWRYTVLYSDNAGPGLVSDKLGNLYGEMGRGQYKYGAIAELSPNSDGWTYTPLYSFCVFQCGYSPSAPPVWDGKGNLFGTTTDGGIAQPACWTYAGCGVIFEMTPNQDGTWTYHILHRFASYPTDGQTPYGSLVMDASGNFYGTTEFGGGQGNGTVFKFSLTNGHWKKTVPYDFPNHAEGWGPDSTLVFDKAGNLYGVGGGGNQGCGPYTCGVVFKLTPQKNGKWTYSVLHKFTGKDGAFPWGVIVDDKGNLFGTTENGGTYNAGVAFEITP
jgi:uncharacterized repeat protein (TIGR03803 family)